MDVAAVGDLQEAFSTGAAWKHSVDGVVLKCNASFVACIERRVAALCFIGAVQNGTFRVIVFGTEKTPRIGFTKGGRRSKLLQCVACSIAARVGNLNQSGILAGWLCAMSLCRPVVGGVVICIADSDPKRKPEPIFGTENGTHFWDQKRVQFLGPRFSSALSFQ